MASPFTAYVTTGGTIRYCGQFAAGYFAADTASNYTVKDLVGLTNVKQVYYNEDDITTIVLFNDGTVKGIGKNNFGTLGLGHINQVTTFTTLPITNVKEIAVCHYCNFFLLNDGTVKATGKNDNTIIDINSTATTIFSTAFTIPITNVRYISGNNLTVANVFFFLNNGDIYCSGDNLYHTMGLATTTAKYLTKLVLENIDTTQIVDIRTSYYTTFFLMKNGDVYASGRNVNGEYGITVMGVTPYDNNVPYQNGIIATNVKAIDNSTKGGAIFFIKNDGTLISSSTGILSGINNGNSTPTLSQYMTFTKPVINSTSFPYRAFFILSDFTVKGCGYSTSGALGGKAVGQYTLSDISFTNLKRIMNTPIKNFNKFLVKKSSSTTLYHPNSTTHVFDEVSNTTSLDFTNGDYGPDTVGTRYTNNSINYNMINLINEPFKIYMEKTNM